MTAGLSRRGFDIDLREGQESEGLLRDILLANGHRVEVKTDYQWADTGNVFVEYEQAGPPSYEPRPSGIALPSDWWAQRLYQDIFVIRPTEQMRRLARESWLDPARRRNGGDHDQYAGVLVPVGHLLRQL